MSFEADNTNHLQDILSRFPGAGRDQLIPLLQAVQETFGYISREAVVEIGRFLGLPSSKIYGVATFYNQFRFRPVGKYHILVCRGTACHVKGAGAVLKALQHALKIEPGQTTRDGLFSLDIVACIGACGLAPALCVNGEFHGNLATDSVNKVLKVYREREKKHDQR